MNTFFIKNSQIHDDIAEISGDDYHHIKSSLRLKEGETVYLCDEDANKYLSILYKYVNSTVLFKLNKKMEFSSESSINVTLYQGLPKQDKLEKVIKETTQLGISEIIPTVMEYSIAKVDINSESKKIDRWNKIAEEAAKQSGRQKIPKICNPIKFKNIIENIPKYDIVLLPYEGENYLTLKDAICKAKENKVDINSIAIIVGPEGGFSQEEISLLSSLDNVYTCTLGKRILRTELAPIMVLSSLVYEFEL